VRFDPDKHRAHQTFESACLERLRSESANHRPSDRRVVAAGAGEDGRR
jgi:hypothetical protein